KCRMIDVIPDDWQQVPKPPLNFLDPSGELRQPPGKVGQSSRFKLLAVYHDAAAITEGIAQTGDECGARVALVGRQELEMLGCCVRLLLHMHAPLERDQVVGTHPCKSRQ